MLVRAVIQGALRKIGIVGGVGRRTPSNQEFADALAVYVSLYRTLITAGTFGRLRDVVPAGDFVAGENMRVFRRYNDQQEILLPDLVSSCGTCGYLWSCDGLNPDPLVPAIPSCDYGRRPYGYNTSGRRTVRDGAVVTLVDEFSGDRLEAIYDGQLKVWFTLSDLDLNEELDEENEWSVRRLNEALDLDAPLSHRDANGLIALLATLLADDFASEVSDMTMRQAMTFKANLVGNYSTYKPEDDCGDVSFGSAPVRVGLFPTTTPTVPEPTEGLILINRGGTTPVSVSGTSQVDLLFIVEGAFNLASVGNVFYFTAANAASLGIKRWRWQIKDISSDQILDAGSIEATGFAS